MSRRIVATRIAATLLALAVAGPAAAQQKIDEEYTKQIKQFLRDPRITTELVDHLPASEGDQRRIEPVYETMEGWQDSTAGARTWNDLPAQAVKYVRHLEELIGAPVALLSTSPEREDTILVHDPFQS